MTPQEHEQSLDRALDDLLGDGSGVIPVDFEPGLLELLPVVHDVRAVLANTPPPPHGLRPGRSAFLTAAATLASTKRSRFSLPAFGRTLSWLAPTVAVLLFALLLTGLFRDNIFPIAPGSSILPEPGPTQSPTLILPTSSPHTAPPVELSTQKTAIAPLEMALPTDEKDIPSGLTGRVSPTAAPVSTNANPAAGTPQQDSISATPPESTSNPSPDTQPTQTSITTPSSTSTPNPSQTPTATLTTTPTLSATPTPISTPPIVSTPPATLTPDPIPITKTPQLRPTSTPTPTRTPNISTQTPQVILPTQTITHLSLEKISVTCRSQKARVQNKTRLKSGRSGCRLNRGF